MVIPLTVYRNFVIALFNGSLLSPTAYDVPFDHNIARLARLYMVLKNRF